MLMLGLQGHGQSAYYLFVFILAWTGCCAFAGVSSRAGNQENCQPRHHEQTAWYIKVVTENRIRNLDCTHLNEVIVVVLFPRH